MEHKTGIARKYADILRYASRQWKALAAILLVTLAFSWLTAFQPWPLKILADSAIGSAPVPSVLASLLAKAGVAPTPFVLVWVAAIASIAIFVVQMALDAALTLGWSLCGQKMVYRLAADLFSQLQRMSLLFHSRQPVGDSIERITTDSWAVYTIAEGLLVSPAKQLIVFATTGFIAWQLDRTLTLWMLATVPCLAASALWFNTRLKRHASAQRAARGRLTAFVHQVLGSIPIVQAFSSSMRNRRTFDALAVDVIGATARSSVVNGAFTMVNGVATTTGIAIVLGVGGAHVLRGELSLGSLLVFLAYARILQNASQALLKTFAELRRAEASVDRVFEILHSGELVRERPGAVPLPSEGPMSRGHLELDRVSFGYRAGEPVLDAVSLDVAPGEVVAIVGDSGSGKSTLAALIPRFHDPWSGAIRIDGIDLRDLTLASLRSEVALVLQDPFILPLSVADNIAYGLPGTTRERIVAAATAANAHEFIARLPDRYETILGEQGANLSGGQRQRIALARAFLRNARVLVMDEPTSALDAGTERDVMDSAFRLMKGRTTLIIAHRLSTIRTADRIVVLGDGRIEEAGTHAELVARGGSYARMVAMNT